MVIMITAEGPALLRCIAHCRLMDSQVPLEELVQIGAKIMVPCHVTCKPGGTEQTVQFSVEHAERLRVVSG